MTDNATENETLDFDIEDEFKPTPLVPKGSYTGHITEALFEGVMLALTVTLNNNDGVLSDGVTPVDGMAIKYKVWFPKPGDETALIKSGIMTKRQWKINNAKKVAEALGISLNSRTVIMESIADGEWIGIPVIAKIDVKEYLGEISNEIVAITRGVDED
jgi:hypothetical protein